MSIAAARVLLKFGANAEATDDLGRKPCESVPDPETFDMVPDAQELIDRMTKLLSEGLETNAAQASVGSLVKSSTKSISGGFSLITCAFFHCKTWIETLRY